MIPWSRRRFLGAGAAALAVGLLPRRGAGFGDATRFDVAELALEGGSLHRPRAWVRLLYEVEQSTSVEVLPKVTRLGPEDPALFDHPFAVLCGAGTPGDLTQEGAGRLARYLQYGGFLFVDDTSGLERSSFDEGFRDLCRRLFPTRPLAPLPADHSVYRSFFLLDRPVGRVARVPYLEGITLGEMTPLLYCRNDLSGALDRGDDGRDRHPVEPGGERQRRDAVKLGVNLVIYALTSNYKKDIAHVRELMRDGRLE